MVGWGIVQMFLLERQKMTVLNVRKFNVQDMTCGHCVGRITKAINALDPQAKVETNVPERKLSVQSGMGVEKLIAAMLDAGYSPVLA